MAKIIKIAPTFGRFLLVGLSGTLVNLMVLWLLVKVGLTPLLAALIATEVSIINNFIWNDCWTFRYNSATGGSWWLRLIRFQLVASLAAVLTLALFSVFTNTLHWHYLVAQFVAIAIATILNFAANSWLTWQIFAPFQDKLAGFKHFWWRLTARQEAK